MRIRIAAAAAAAAVAAADFRVCRDKLQALQEM